MAEPAIDQKIELQNGYCEALRRSGGVRNLQATYRRFESSAGLKLWALCSWARHITHNDKCTVSTEE